MRKINGARYSLYCNGDVWDKVTGKYMDTILPEEHGILDDLHMSRKEWDRVFTAPEYRRIIITNHTEQ